MVSATTGATPASGSMMQNTQKNQLDQDAFLKLLINQLRNQDPLKPMDDKEFIAQLAQFSTLEQMQKMNERLGQMADSQASFQQGLALIGKMVEAINPAYSAETDPSSATTIKGKVDGVDYSYGVPLLKIQDKLIPLDNILSVS